MTTTLTVYKNNESISFSMQEGSSTLVERRVNNQIVATSYYSHNEACDIIHMYLKEGYHW